MGTAAQAELGVVEADGFVRLTAEGGVRLKKTKEVGDGKVPVAGEELAVHYRGYVKTEDVSKKEIFDDSWERGQPLTFQLGQGQVVPGWDVAFLQMKVGETAVVECGPDFAYGEEGHPPRIPGNSTLVFEVELVSAKMKEKELFEMSAEEKETEALKAKARGLDFFQKSLWHEASEAFGSACHFCDVAHYTREDKALPDSVAAIYASCQSNSAACGLKLKDWPFAARSATLALKCLDFENDAARAKCLFRRGVARGHMGLLDEAKDDLQKAARLEPKNRAVRTELAKMKEQALTQKKAQQNSFKGAFEKANLFPDKPRNLSHPSTDENPYAFLDVTYFQENDDGSLEEKTGQIVLRVYADACPRTARNFLALCSGERGLSRNSYKPLHYKNTKVHRIVSDFMIQAGDVTLNDGTSGESIFGRFFDDEHFKIKHDKPGILSMANKGPNTNASQFFITVDEASHCDGKCVAFGTVVAGMDIVHTIAQLPTKPDSQIPLHDVTIVDCGHMDKQKADSAITWDKDAQRHKEKEEKAAASKKEELVAEKKEEQPMETEEA